MGTVGDPPPFGRVLVVGCGLVGGSLALALQALWTDLEIRVLDPGAPATLRDRFTLATSPTEAGWADLVVLGAPVSQNLALLDALARHVAPEAVVTDVGSTKRDIVTAARHERLRGVFVGGHPMAGSAQSGFVHARAGLFAGRPWILTPDTDGPVAAARVGTALARLTQLVCAIGARPFVMGAEDHDRLVAYVSHMPQLVSSAVMTAAGRAVQRDGLRFSGPGLVDVTRLAGSSPSLWHDILASNADFVHEALRALRDVLPASDSPAVVPPDAEALITEGRRWRQALEAAAPAQTGDRRVLHRPAIRTYLEMTHPDALVGAEFTDEAADVVRVTDGPASLYRYLYREVGRPWHWLDRWDWSDRRIREHLDSPGIELWLLTVGRVPTGFFELHRTSNETEIAYFGLLPEFTGRGLGKALLTCATREAWRSTPRRVWLHTCSLDHPAAIRNYTARGFVPYREEAYDARIPLDPS